MLCPRVTEKRVMQEAAAAAAQCGLLKALVIHQSPVQCIKEKDLSIGAMHLNSSTSPPGTQIQKLELYKPSTANQKKKKCERSLRR